MQDSFSGRPGCPQRDILLSKLTYGLLRLAGRMQNSFHGRTFGAMALTTSKTYYRQGFAPLMPQVVVAPYPYCLHCKVRAAHPEGDSWYKVNPAAHLGLERDNCCRARCACLIRWRALGLAGRLADGWQHTAGGTHA